MRKTLAAIAAVMLVLTVAACTDDAPKNAAQQQAEDVAQNRNNYVPQNDVEGRNYNARQELADSPATLIWCTAFPSSPNARAFTVPIVGKLTSGNKRPYPTSQTVIDGDTSGMTYNPELPGADGMYGTSGEYRYGFDPAGNYHDYYNLETYCTTVPNVLQKEQTTIIIGVSGDLATLDSRAEDALARCRAADPDPSHLCAEASQILGVS